MIMNRKSCKSRYILIIFILSAGSLILTSCLDIETEIRIDRNGRVDTVLTYILDSTVADFGRSFGSDEEWPLPLSEKDFQQRMLLTQGSEIRGYRIRKGQDGAEVVEISIRSESIEALAEYLGMGIEYTGNRSSGSLDFKLPDAGDYASSSEATRDIIDSLIGDSRIRFEVRPPSRPIDSGFGSIEGRFAVLEVSLSEILYGEYADNWTISW